MPSNCSAQRLIYSLKWHYEVFRFLDQYVKNAK
jgi:hypothetical protein